MNTLFRHLGRLIGALIFLTGFITGFACGHFHGVALVYQTQLNSDNDALHELTTWPMLNKSVKGKK